jgi:acetolactate synthase-1/2/3 large subunit
LDVPEELADVFEEARERILGVGAAPPADAVDDAVVEAIDRAERPVVLAGPGVVLHDAVDGLRALASAGSLGVLNTWGAKGVFDWRSPHHLATAGLQARDFELGGVADADLIIATGLDEREVRGDWRLAPVVEIAPASLREVATRISRREREIAVPPLRAELARVTQAGWSAQDGPLPPTKVTQHYSQVLGDGGLVAADPGTAGYWVARTFATQRLGGAQVTADGAGRGFAVACATVARLADPGRAVLAVVDQLDGPTLQALEAAAREGIAVPVEVWGAGGPSLGADAHEARLRALVRDGRQAAIATDASQLDEMLAVAGPIVAWTR